MVNLVVPTSATFGVCSVDAYLSSWCHFVDVKTKWENSSWGKKLVVQKRRASLNDFDRFKVMLAKIKVRHFTTIWFISVGHAFFHLLNLSFFI